jgi:nitrite reductase/ring-hydroxylating ferredoxin subunit
MSSNAVLSSEPQTPTHKRYCKLAETHEIAPNSGKTVYGPGGQQIAIFNLNGTFYAISDGCPHRGAPLSEGLVKGEMVLCAWQCFDFNLKTGACEVVPELRVETYEVKVEGDAIFVLC